MSADTSWVHCVSACTDDVVWEGIRWTTRVRHVTGSRWTPPMRLTTWECRGCTPATSPLSRRPGVDRSPPPTTTTRWVAWRNWTAVRPPAMTMSMSMCGTRRPWPPGLHDRDSSTAARRPRRAAVARRRHSAAVRPTSAGVWASLQGPCPVRCPPGTPRHATAARNPLSRLIPDARRSPSVVSGTWRAGRLPGRLAGRGRVEGKGASMTSRGGSVPTAGTSRRRPRLTVRRARRELLRLDWTRRWRYRDDRILKAFHIHTGAPDASGINVCFNSWPAQTSWKAHMWNRYHYSL